MAENFIVALNLQLFAEGAGASVGAGAEGGTAAQGTTGVISADAGRSKGAKNPLADVIYGKQPGVQDAAAQTGGDIAPPDADAAFDALIKGEYKDQFGKKVEDIVQRRLKGTKETVDRYEKLAPVLEMLGQKYGVDAKDADALAKALQDDDSYYEEEAFEKGISVEQLKQIKAMERENAQLKAQMQEAAQRQAIDRDLANWMEQAEKAAEVFPGLDLNVELQNPQFFGLLRDGIDLETAYFAVHHRELVPKAMQFAADTARKQTASAIRSGQNRPTENGMRGSAPAVVKSDVSQLTKADRAEIIRRVQRGEKIRF